jgi:RNA polymerase sigma-70 factor (ECF subfamily)
VLGARGDSPEAKSALGDLCAAYYAPVFAFIRFNTRDEEAAKDLTQEFFARLMARHGVDTADPGRGRFRSYLLGAVKHFLSDIREHAGRLKRGAGQSPEPLEPGTDTSPRRELAADKSLQPDREFDRKWALTLLDQALTALALEHQAAGTAVHFEALKPWLAGDTSDLSQSDAARRLGMNEGAVKVAIHRLRRQFRKSVKAEIGRTLNDPALVDNELACLLAALYGT